MTRTVSAHVLGLLAGAALLACGDGPTGPRQPSGSDGAPQQFASAHFLFTYPAGDAEAVRTIAAAADADVARILGVSPEEFLREWFAWARERASAVSD